MLPEHIQLLNDLWAMDNYKEKPILDEQELMAIDLKLRMAMKDNLTVEVDYFADNDFHTISGKLLSIDSIQKKLRFENGEDEIVLEDIIDVRIQWVYFT